MKTMSIASFQVRRSSLDHDNPGTPHGMLDASKASDSAPLWTQGILFLSTNSSLSKQPKSGRKLSATAEICALWFQSVTMDSEIGASFRLPLRQPLFMPDTAREMGEVL
jgi:hypothetical protein